MSDDTTKLLNACVEYRAMVDKLEAENAMLREITSMLGAPNHVGVSIEQWRELREDKERLDWIIGQAHYLFFKDLGSDLAKGREQIDAARKEAHP